MWMIVALLGIVIILYASMLPRTAASQAPMQDDFLDSVGDTLQHFADEMEEENKELLRMVGDMKREHDSRTNTLLSRIEQLEKQSATMQNSLSRPSPMPPMPASSMVPPVIVPTQETAPASLPSTVERALTELKGPGKEPEQTSRFANTVKDRYKELFELHDSGKSVEYIAKRLGKNKGEVQLIIGLARQEEPQHGQS
jgi:hypothetical protein